ncbi:MAG: hypothetical protein U0869_05165 [Chloroflexota bacterium]
MDDLAVGRRVSAIDSSAAGRLEAVDAGMADVLGRGGRAEHREAGRAAAPCRARTSAWMSRASGEAASSASRVAATNESVASEEAVPADAAAAIAPTVTSDAELSSASADTASGCLQPGGHQTGRSGPGP